MDDGKTAARTRVARLDYFRQDWTFKAERDANRLAGLYSLGFEHGLRGEEPWISYEGSQVLHDMYERGYASGLLRRRVLDREA
jgi:hypothetical protein